MKKFGIIVLFFIIILAFTCQMPIRRMKKTNEKNHLEERDGLFKSGIHDAPGLNDYVGRGYNLLDGQRPYIGTALNRDLTTDSVVFEYDGITNYKYILIEDNSDLIELDSLDAHGSAEGAYGIFSIKGSAKYAVENNLSISNKSISVLVIAKYNYGSVMLDKTEFLGDYLTLLNENKELFYETFGNGYSRTTKLGGYLFCLYTLSLKERAEMEYESLKAAVEGKVAGLFSIEGGVDIESLYSLESEHVEIRANLFSIGPPDFVPGIPTNNEEMTAIITEFKNSMTSTFSKVELDKPETCQFLPCLETKYESYEDLASRLDTLNTYSCDIDEYYNKKMSWWKLYGKLDRVRKDLDANTFSLPTDVINSYKTQVLDKIDGAGGVREKMELCKSRDPNASFAEDIENIDLINQINNLINIFKIKLELPGIFTVVDQSSDMRLSWIDDLGLSNFALLLNTEAESIKIQNQNFYNYIPKTPGITTWSVLGYSNNGVPIDSIQRSFIVPGFNLQSMQVPEGLTIPGTTIRFYIVNKFPGATGMTNSLCVKRNTNPIQKINLSNNTYIDYTFEEADSIYTVWIEGSCNGTIGNSTSLTIDTSNNPPVLNPIGNKEVANFSTLSFTITADDVENDPLTYSALNLPSGANFNAITGEFNWTPLDTQLGTYTINFEVSDGEDIDTQEVIITCYNNPPVLNEILPKNVLNGQTLSFTLEGSDVDGDNLSYDATGMPLGATLDTNTGEFNWTPSQGQSEVYTVTFYVTDEKDTVSQVVTITCDNNPPTLEHIPDRIVSKNELVTITLVGSDLDGNDLRYYATGMPPGATLDQNTGIFNWNSQAGIYTVTFYATDEIDTISQDVIIACDNRPPRLNTISDKETYEDKGEKIEFTVTGEDDDNDNLTFSYNVQTSEIPGGATFNENTGKFSWTPTNGQAGIYDIYFLAYDGDDYSESMKVTITCWDLFKPNANEIDAGYGYAEYVKDQNKAGCGGASGQYGGYGKVIFNMTGGSRYRAEFNITINTGIGGFGYFYIAGGRINKSSSNLLTREWTSGNCYIHAGSNGGASLTNLKFYRKP